MSDNINTFIKNNIISNEKSKEKLVTFSRKSKYIRKLLLLFSFFKLHPLIKKGNNNYIFTYQGKDYSFNIFSEIHYQKFDELLRKRKDKRLYLRALKHIFTIDLINPCLIIGHSNLNKLNLLISYKKDEKENIIDYVNNIIMNKDDYYNLFNFKDYNIINQNDLAFIYNILEKLNDFDYIYEFLLFSKEILSELSKRKDCKYISNKYYKFGVNPNNMYFLGDYNDALFFEPEDDRPKNFDIDQELQYFTENPSKATKHIYYDDNINEYVVERFGHTLFSFSLMSNYEEFENEKACLLSESRYHQCHYNAWRLAHYLPDIVKENIYVVGGKIKVNEHDFFYHSWLEINEKVFDFNRNLVMDKETYYKYLEVKIIEKSKAEEIVLYTDILTNHLGLINNCFDIIYLGKELTNDIMKNPILLKKI